MTTSRDAETPEGTLAAGDGPDAVGLPLGLKVSRSFLRASALILETVLVSTLLVWWLASGTIRVSHNLWVLFIYSFPSEFILAIVPHEPVLIYFGKFHAPLVVALVAVSSTVLVELLNYGAFAYMADRNFMKRFTSMKSVTRLVRLFNKSPFIALWIAGFAPVPFYPFRFLVVLAEYPWWKYALAVLASRAPRFYLLALAGDKIRIPSVVLISLFVVLVVAPYLPVLIATVRKLMGSGGKGSAGGGSEPEQNLP
jgi:membrane protein YqaA with SNARE-associated domain